MAPNPGDLDTVRRINVFHGLNPRMIQQMIAPATTLALREREVVCRQDDPATAFGSGGRSSGSLLVAPKPV